MVTEEALGQLIKQWIVDHGHASGIEVADDLDLLASGALDSMGFIELLAYTETVIGQQLDLRKLDLDACSSIHGLVHSICRGIIKTPEGKEPMYEVRPTFRANSPSRKDSPWW